MAILPFLSCAVQTYKKQNFGIKQKNLT